MADEPQKGAALRRQLLAKLPPLEYHGASLLETMQLDKDADLRGALELDADAFLTPLEQAARRRGAK